MFNTKNYISPVMVNLYGEDEAIRVASRCYEVDSFFGEWVQRYIYDLLWTLKPLDMLQKSIITIVSLTVLGKEEQLSIHIKGFLNLTDNNVAMLKLIFKYLFDNHFLVSSEQANLLFDDILKERKVNVISKNQFELSEKLKSLLKISATVALGTSVKTSECLSEEIQNNHFSEEELRAIMRHQLTYC